MWVRMGRINIRDRILYVYMYTGYIMAKLYWRYKKNGKWTWKAATIHGWTTDMLGGLLVEPHQGMFDNGKDLEEEE